MATPSPMQQKSPVASGIGGVSAVGGVDLYELSKGWKAAIARAKDPATRHEVRIKNDRGNLPLHAAASFRAPLEVTEALLEIYPEAASITNNYGNLALHFTAWKKGPSDVEILLLKVFPEGASQPNNSGNLPLHYAAHYNAPIEVVEPLYHAYPSGANQKNGDGNTPLDLAINDGAGANVVALLQGKSVPPTEEERLSSAKAQCALVEKEIQRNGDRSGGGDANLNVILKLLLDVHDRHPHALHSAGINPAQITSMESLTSEVRKAGQDAMQNPSNDAEDAESQLIEDSLCPPDDPVEGMLSQLIGLETVKCQIRGFRRTVEMSHKAMVSDGGRMEVVPRHMTFIGNPGTGKRTVARKLAHVLFDMGAVGTRNFVEVGRDQLIDPKSEARTISKTRSVIERASGGVLILDEAYQLLPSTARPRGRDHGGAALRELARALPNGSPLVILTGTPMDLQRVLSSDIGFKGHFLTRVEFPDPSPEQIARIFMIKMSAKGLVPAEGVTIPYLAELIGSNTEREWRLERNGFIADLLLVGVRHEIKKRRVWTDDGSRASLSPMKFLSPGSSRIPAFAPEEVFVTVEDIQNAIVNGM